MSLDIFTENCNDMVCRWNSWAGKLTISQIVCSLPEMVSLPCKSIIYLGSVNRYVDLGE